MLKRAPQVLLLTHRTCLKTDKFHQNKQQAATPKSARCSSKLGYSQHTSHVTRDRKGTLQTNDREMDPRVLSSCPRFQQGTPSGGKSLLPAWAAALPTVVAFSANSSKLAGNRSHPIILHFSGQSLCVRQLGDKVTFAVTSILSDPTYFAAKLPLGA